MNVVDDMHRSDLHGVAVHPAAGGPDRIEWAITYKRGAGNGRGSENK